MPIEFNCHVCGKLLRTSDDKAGRTAKCPGCGENLQVPDGEFDPTEQDSADDYQDLDGGREEYDDEEEFGEIPLPAAGSGGMKDCPMCGEQISRRSTRCEYCGESVSGGSRRGRSSDVALEKVAGPAIGLMVAAGMGIAVQMLGTAVNIMQLVVQGRQPGFPGGGQAMPVAMQGGIGLAFNAIAIIIGVVIIIGAVKMKRLESHGMAMTSAIIAMIPCISPCCLIGLPIGIWALVVINDDEVKNAFQG